MKGQKTQTGRRINKELLSRAIEKCKGQKEGIGGPRLRRNPWWSQRVKDGPGLN